MDVLSRVFHVRSGTNQPYYMEYRFRYSFNIIHREVKGRMVKFKPIKRNCIKSKNTPREIVRQGKSELLTLFHCSSIRPKWKTWRTEDKERRSDNNTSWRYYYVPVDKTLNNQKGSKILRKKTSRSNQENNQPMTGTHPLRNKFNPHLFRRQVLRISRWRNRRTMVSDWWIQISVFSWPDCILPFWKTQIQLPPYNLPCNLYKWQPGGV